MVFLPKQNLIMSKQTNPDYGTIHKATIVDTSKMPGHKRPKKKRRKRNVLD